jgi:hypothetical protein
MLNPKDSADFKVQKVPSKDGVLRDHQAACLKRRLAGRSEVTAAVEKQKRDDEQKKKEKEDWKNKMIVADPTFHVSLRGAKAGPLWSLTGLLQDPCEEADSQDATDGT